MGQGADKLIQILEEDLKKKDVPKKEELRFLRSQGVQKASFLRTYYDRVVIFSQSVSLTQYVVLSVRLPVCLSACLPACLVQLAYCLNDQAHIA